MDKYQLLVINWRFLAFALILLSASASIGCGSSEEPMGLLSGSVMSGGQACGNCKIAIYDPKTMRSIGTTVNETGTFVMNDVPFAEYQVTVQQKPTNDMVEVFDTRIPRKYRNTDTSGITVSFETADEVVLNIEMD